MEYVLAIRRHNQVRGYSFFDASSFLPLLPLPPHLSTLFPFRPLFGKFVCYFAP